MKHWLLLSVLLCDVALGVTASGCPDGRVHWLQPYYRQDLIHAGGASLDVCQPRTFFVEVQNTCAVKGRPQKRSGGRRKQKNLLRGKIHTRERKAEREGEAKAKNILRCKIHPHYFWKGAREGREKDALR